MRLLLIANPIAGGNARPTIDQAMQLLKQTGAEVELALTSAAGDAENWAGDAATEGRFDRILVAGGDGTLNEAANGLVCSDLPLAFLPLGTTNVFALEAGLPKTLSQLCQLALTAPARKIHLGLAGERLFLLMAGLGFDAESIYRMKPGLKRRIGKGAYLVSALSTLADNPPFSLELETEQGSFQGTGAIISNCRLYGGPFSITPNASMFHDSFEVCLFKTWNRRILFRHALRLLRRQPLDPDLVEMFSCRQVEVKQAGLPIQLDGDYFSRTPMTFAIAGRGLQMVLP